MTNLPEEYTVFTRYLLLLISGVLFSNGVSLEEGFNFAINDPDMLQLITSVVFTVVAVVWYKFSEARQALLDHIAQKRSAVGKKS